MAKVIERVQAHYGEQKVEFGRVYKWYPKSVLVKCECGEKVALTASDPTCEECGAQHARFVREDLTDEHRLEVDEEVLHPWRYSRESSNETSLPY